MTSINRKVKWKGIKLNESNVDEYIEDLKSDTKGQHIIQAISFNKDDKLEMSIYKNVLLSQGSFGGFIKTLLRKYFEQQGKLDDDEIWLPNVDLVGLIDKGNRTTNIPHVTPPASTPPAIAEEVEEKTQQQELQLISEEENPPVDIHEENTVNGDKTNEPPDTTSSNDEISATTQKNKPSTTTNKPQRKTSGTHRRKPKTNAFTQPPKG
ncbi:hypothetical protein ACIQ1D_19250 [Lysinibacillus xylanilyticus]|uniref:hypothetical protein n=1 Tax=Lysinibacillus xylanilyticus TaxID=582475 RepID=UPI0037F88740